MQDGVIASLYNRSTQALTPAFFSSSEGGVVLFRQDKHGPWQESRRILGEQPGDRAGFKLKLGSGVVAFETTNNQLDFFQQNVRNDPNQTERVRIVPLRKNGN